MGSPRRVVITGAPGAGKSTLLNELSRRGLTTAPEVARQILKAPGGMVLRAERPVAFAHAMHDAELAAYHGAAADGPVVFDRGFPDIVGFLKVEGLRVPQHIAESCRTLRYSGPIFRAPAWEMIYHSDAERIQNWEEAVASDIAVTSAWRNYGYDVVDLPMGDVRQRAKFILDRL